MSLPSDVVLGILQTEYGVAPDSIELVYETWGKTVTKVSAGDKKYAFKTYEGHGEAYESGEALKQSCFRAGVPMATPVAAQHGESFVHYLLNDRDVIVAELNEWLEIVPGDKPYDDLYAVGRLFGLLHAASLPASPTVKARTTSITDQAFDSLGFLRPYLSDEYHDLVTSLIQKTARFETSGRVAVTNSDAAANMLVTPEGLKLIDFEYAEAHNLDLHLLDATRDVGIETFATEQFVELFEGYASATGKQLQLSDAIGAMDVVWHLDALKVEQKANENALQDRSAGHLRAKIINPSTLISANERSATAALRIHQASRREPPLEL